MLTEKVEIGFEEIIPGANWFTLDDATKGKLDNTTYLLSGFAYYDVTQYATDIEVTRGKSDDLGNISSGELVVTLNNRTRAFDPTYASSPYYGNILPKRVVRYSVNGIQQYQGIIDDWNLENPPDGDSKATFVASDGFVYLANQTLAAGTATAQLSGARITSILNDQYVKWDSEARDIDAGTQMLGADVIPDGQNVLEYLQTIEVSELGIFFISKDGKATFNDRSHVPSTTGLVKLSDDGTGVKYQNLKIAYGSEDLINEVDATSVITNVQTLATDTDSQLEFGIFNATFDTLLLQTDAQVATFASTLLAKYSQPVYRFSEVEIRLNDLTDSEANSILGLELGDFVQVVFTPNNIPPAINKYAEVIRNNHSVTADGEHIVTLGLNTLNFTYLVLDDTVFGKLDEGSLS